MMTALVAGLVTLAVLVSATVLAWHGAINGEAIVGVYTTVLSGTLVAGVSHIATRQGARAALATTTADLAPPPSS